MRRSDLVSTPLLLLVRDGWGENPHDSHDAFNAVKLARTPVADRLREHWPTTLIRTCGEDVGLPGGTMGNSEVGHQNIGAGRIVNQELMRITSAIHAGELARNDVLLAALRHLERSGGRLHLLGLCSNGRVHSDLEHARALVDFAAAGGLPTDRLLVHAITDGRDTGPFTGLEFVRGLEDHLAAAGIGRIASVLGRYYAMDRDHRWDRVALAYACLTGVTFRGTDDELAGLEVRTCPSAGEAIQHYYDDPTEASRRGDEFIVPARIESEPGDDGRIRDGDAVVFFNYRGDRPREITKAFVLDDEAWAQIKDGGFDRGQALRDLHFCTLSSYEEGLPVHVVFERPPKMSGILGAVLAEREIPQFRCAETEKYPHVTFFFNDYREEPFPLEHRTMIMSPQDVSTYDQKPQMSAPEIADAVCARLESPDCEPLLVVNLANGDMVGHTGNLAATVRAVEVVDECTGRMVDAALAAGGAAIVTADHGNAEQMWDPGSDAPHTAHTVYDVPLMVVGAAFEGRSLRSGGRLADVAPTALTMMGLDPPPEMTGRSLLG